MSRSVPLLLYHSISDRTGPRFRRWTVPPAHFTQHAALLVDEGYEALTVAEYLECRLGIRSFPARPVVLTFDDGFADFATAALPVLHRYGLKATLYVTSGYIGGTSRWLIREGEVDRRMLSWDELAAFPAELVELGGHGYSHRQLDTLPAAEALADVVRGISVLEERTGRKVGTFAYPHGYSTPALRRGLVDLGLAGACGVVDAPSTPDDPTYCLARLIVDADMDAMRLHRLLEHSAGVTESSSSHGWRQRLWRRWRKARLQLGIDSAHVPD